MYGNPAGYDAFMGRWSRALAPAFVTWLGLPDRIRVLDLGAGTGALSTALSSALPQARISAIDPVDAFVTALRAASPTLDVHQADGDDLPFDDGHFDAVASLLVLQDLPDRTAALAENARVTRPGGTITACQWDFDHGMPVLGVMRDAIAAAGAAPHEEPQSANSGAASNIDELTDIWHASGFESVETKILSVDQTYDGFEALWQPYLAASTPSTARFSDLNADTRAAVRQQVKTAVLGRKDDGPIHMTASAWCVRGIVPKRTAS